MGGGGSNTVRTEPDARPDLPDSESRLLPQHPPCPGETRAGRAAGGPRSRRGGGKWPRHASLPAPPHRRGGTRVPTVIVGVHLPEDLVCPLLRSGLVLGHLHHGGHHFVNRLQRGAYVEACAQRFWNIPRVGGGGGRRTLPPAHIAVAQRSGAHQPPERTLSHYNAGGT